ncbi:HIT-like domain-containing protein, partial [Mycena rosella]
LVRETPDIYSRIVQPYISEFPPERTRWVEEILSGHKEQSKILFSSPDFMILPDMKWDLHTTSSLYLIAIVRDKILRSLRDLRADKALGHISLLKSIRREAYTIAHEKWGIECGGLRMYIHYQPSYYHFHVHIVNANYEAGMGMSVGQAHLLEDVISLLDEENLPDSPGIFERMTLTYGLGEQHGLF